MAIGAVRFVLYGLGAAAIVGSFDGAVARLLMRLFSVVGDGQPVLTLAGTLSIVVLFVVSVIPGGIASAAAKGRRVTVFLYVVGALPVMWSGFAIGWQEWAAAADRGLNMPQFALLMMLTFGIAAVTASNPFLTHRLAVRMSAPTGQWRFEMPRASSAQQ